jgi:hypothetical protein
LLQVDEEKHDAQSLLYEAQHLSGGGVGGAGVGQKAQASSSFTPCAHWDPGAAVGNQ